VRYRPIGAARAAAPQPADLRRRRHHRPFIGIKLIDLRAIVARHTLGRQLGVLGEPRVNVLELNMELDAVGAVKK
jgi:K+-transporting ATPase c subunit